MNNDYELICRAVEQSVGYSPKTPKDFARLSDEIFGRLHQRDLNELRITFVRGLTPDGDSLTFCGVYRMDMSLSNFHHVTWRRVADRIDLEHLDYLEQLRN